MKVKYLNIDDIDYKYLTPDKVYDVIHYISVVDDYLYDKVYIQCDNSKIKWFFVYSSKNNIIFKNVTAESRNEIINGILE